MPIFALLDIRDLRRELDWIDKTSDTNSEVEVLASKVNKIVDYLEQLEEKIEKLKAGTWEENEK